MRRLQRLQRLRQRLPLRRRLWLRGLRGLRGLLSVVWLLLPRVLDARARSNSVDGRRSSWPGLTRFDPANHLLFAALPPRMRRS
jgi:hypothetical protein